MRAMKTDFEEFKSQFDAFLEACDEDPPGILFLRYEDLEAASHLHTVADQGFSPARALDDYLETLTECQDYAVSKGVTSTYVFFDPQDYTRWLEERGWQDNPWHRAQWAQTQVDEEVIPHPARGIIWFRTTGVPVHRFVDVLE